MTKGLLTHDWLNRLRSYPQLMVGFSGGLDSTVLLHVLAKEPALIGKLKAVHVHHGLSANADAWLLHCQQFCDSLSIPLIIQTIQIDAHKNIEERARLARYQAFSKVLGDNDLLLLAHHADDQAETLLLQLFRGAGIDGMAAMMPLNRLAQGTLARPFLAFSRSALDVYAKAHELTWIEDESNQDTAFSRNYLRHQILPLLQEKWPGVVHNLVRSAAHCQTAKRNLDSLAHIDMVNLSEQGNTLSISALCALSVDRTANVLHTWLKNNNVRRPSTLMFNQLMNEIVLARDDATPVVSWDGLMVRRYQQTLYLLKHPVTGSEARIEWITFPATVEYKTGCELHALPAIKGLRVPLGSKVHIDYRQGGELFYWRGQTKQLKKLWQQWKIPPWQRAHIPLLYVDNVLAAVVGFAISDHYYSIIPKDTYDIRAC